MSKILDIMRGLTGNSGTNDVTTTNTPASTDNSKKIANTEWCKFGFQAVLSGNGYVKFPNWLGGVIIQWGLKTVVAGNNTVTFPLQFPTSLFSVVATQQSPYGSGLTVNNIVTVSLIDTATFNIATNAPGGVNWFAVGI